MAYVTVYVKNVYVNSVCACVFIVEAVLVFRRAATVHGSPVLAPLFLRPAQVRERAAIGRESVAN